MRTCVGPRDDELGTECVDPREPTVAGNGGPRDDKLGTQAPVAIDATKEHARVRAIRSQPARDRFAGSIDHDVDTAER